MLAHPTGSRKNVASYRTADKTILSIIESRTKFKGKGALFLGIHDNLFTRDSMNRFANA